MPSQGKKRHYKPPQADSNTFDTQQEFLDSLQAVPIQDVPEKNRKCAHCWKPYGESDIGLNNAEDPVRLRCNHVFGEKCLKELFACPESIEVDLVPLSFAPGSRGSELVHHLATYIQQRNADKGVALNDGSCEEDFAQLLEELTLPPARPTASRGLSTFGQEWHHRLQQALSLRTNVMSIHFLENGLVFDAVLPNVKESLQPPPISDSLPFTVNPLTYLHSSHSHDPYLSNTGNPAFTPSAGQYLYEAALQAASETTDSASEVDDDDAMTVSPAPADSKPSPGPPNTSSEQDTLQLLNKSLPIVELPPMPSMAEPYSKAPSAPGEISMGISFTEVPTPTVIPSAPMSNILVQEKLKEVLKQLEDPILAQYLPYPHPIEDDSELFDSPASGSSAHHNILSSWKGLIEKAPQEVPKASPFHTNSDHLVPSSPDITGEKKPGSGKDEYPNESNIDKLLALQKKLGKASQALKTAKNTQAAHQAHMELVNKRAEKFKEERATRKKTIISLLSKSLATIFSDHEQWLNNEAIAIGRPPAGKRMKLTPSGVKPVKPSSPPSPALHHPLIDSLHLSVNIHEKHIAAKSYEVPQPYLHQDDYESGDESQEDDSRSNISKRTIFLTRTTCRRCFKQGDSCRKAFHKLPDFVFWKDHNSTPDGCPICQKVLFRKESCGSSTFGSLFQYGEV